MKSDFQEKRERRVNRYEALAAKSANESTDLFQKAHNAAAVMNGQPILVGHHSEKRHRRDLDRMHDNMQRSVQAQKRAEYYERAAQAAKENRAISSDDPEALAKLREKLAHLQAHQERMKQINRAVAKTQRIPDEQKIEALAKALGVESDQAAKYLVPDFAGRIGIPRYALSNNLQVIAATKKRIASLESMEAAKDETIQMGEIEIKILPSENRVQILFPGKPEEITRQKLRGFGFRWAPSIGVWQANYSPQAIYRAKKVAESANNLTNQTNELK